jgi:DNA-binding transcriptional regulator YhcF (GntR family)
MSPLSDRVDITVDRDSDVPLGAQLASTVREAIADGRLAAGDRLPSVRELAIAAGVNVNTARAIYQRLEHEGLVRSEQGRGTFVAPRGRHGGGGEASARRELRQQIARLEAELARRPPPPGDPFAPAPAEPAGRLMTAAELRGVRDGLLSRLRDLDEARTEVLRSLAELEHAEAPQPEPASTARHSTLSLPGARVRWVGA